MKFNLIGASYESQAINADAQKTMNWHPEIIESQTGKSKVALYPTPGILGFSAITDTGTQSAHISSVEVEHGLGNRATISALEVLDHYDGTATAGASVGSLSPWTNPANAASPTNYATAVLPYDPTGLDTTINVTMDARCAPWNPTDSGYPYGISSPGNQPPSVVAYTLEAGQIVTISAVVPTGVRPKHEGGYISDGNGGTAEHPQHPFTHNDANTPAAWMSGTTLGICGLCGAFTDAAGKVVAPISVGTGGTFTAPAGATKIQFGVNDDRFDDEQGSFVFTVVISAPQQKQVTDNLDVSGFGFAIPADQTINGVAITFDTAYSGDITKLTYNLQLMSAGIVVGNVVSKACAAGTVTFDTGWNTSFTPALLNATDAGVRINVSVPRLPGDPSKTVSIKNVKAKAIVSTYVKATTAIAHGYSVGNSIAFTRVGNNSWLNDQSITLDAVTSTTFTGIYAHAVVAEMADTGFAWDGGLTDPYVIIRTVEANPFLNGQVVTFSALGTSTFLNGHSSTVLTHDTTQFTADFAYADYGPVAETLGSVILGAVTGFNPARDLHEINGRCFTATGPNFFEVMADGTYIIRGGVVNDGKPISMASTAEEVVICAGGHLYLFTLANNNFAAISDTEGLITNIAKVEYCDGYFIGLIANARQFRISGIENGAVWDPLDITTISVFPDNAMAMIVDHREIWIWGSKKAVVYYNSGNADFPFDVIASGYIDQGAAALFSPVRLDNSVFWLGKDERGQGIVWRAQGYLPQRVSNHALEYAIQGYARVDDAVAYGFQMNGHSYYHLYFPTPGKSWRYDCSTGSWCEVGYLRSDAVWEAHHSQCHCFAFGKHLVGDWSSGNVYELALKYGDDNGQPIRRERRSPHISNENQWLRHSQLTIDAECGLGLESGVDPQLMVRWSDDGGHTWSDEHWIAMSLGRAGEFRKRIVLRRLGRSRDRVYEIACSEPIPVRLVDGYLEVS